MAVGVSSLTTLADAFKTVFSQKAIIDESVADKPLWGMMNKATDFYGDEYKEYVRYGKPVGGASKTFSYAQANVSSSRGVAFTVTRVPDYGFVHLDRESIEAAEKDVGNDGCRAEP